MFLLYRQTNHFQLLLNSTFYFQITGNNHSKARLSKKWQNINYTKKVKSGKVTAVHVPDKDNFSELNPSKHFQPDVLNLTENDLEARPELSADSGSSLPESKGFAEGPENIWSAGQNALRDLLLYLIQKHNLEEVSNPKTRYLSGLSRAKFHDEI